MIFSPFVNLIITFITLFFKFRVSVTLVMLLTGEEFKQAKLNLNHWKNYDNLSRAEYFNQSKIKALVAPVKKVKKW